MRVYRRADASLCRPGAVRHGERVLTRIMGRREGELRRSGNFVPLPTVDQITPHHIARTICHVKTENNARMGAPGPHRTYICPIKVCRV